MSWRPICVCVLFSLANCASSQPELGADASLISPDDSATRHDAGPQPDASIPPGGTVDAGLGDSGGCESPATILGLSAGAGFRVASFGSTYIQGNEPKQDAGTYSLVYQYQDGSTSFAPARTWHGWADTNYGNDGKRPLTPVLVKGAKDLQYSRKGYFQFAIGSYPYATVSSVELTLHTMDSLVGTAAAGGWDFAVYGGCSSEPWRETDEEIPYGDAGAVRGLTWNNAVFNDVNSGFGVLGPDAGVAPLGMFSLTGKGLTTVDAGDAGELSVPQVVGGVAFVNLVQDCLQAKRPFLTMIIVRTTNSNAGDYVHAFASDWHPIDLRPTLDILPQTPDLVTYPPPTGVAVHPSANTYVDEYSPGVAGGGSPQLLVKDAIGYTRNAYMRFDPSSQGIILARDAALILHMVDSKSGNLDCSTEWTFDVYGVGLPSASAAWSETGASALTWDSVKSQMALDPAQRSSWSNAGWEHSAGTDNATPLASFTVQGTGAGSTVVVMSAALTSYVNRVLAREEQHTFIITRSSPQNSSLQTYVHAFASSHETEQSLRPTLLIQPLAGALLPDMSDEFSDAIVQGADGGWAIADELCPWVGESVREAANVSTNNGDLLLTTHFVNDAGFSCNSGSTKYCYSSASVSTMASTPTKPNQKRGAYFAARIKLPNASGQNNAFWASNTYLGSASATSGCELDITEAHYPNQHTMTLHKHGPTGVGPTGVVTHGDVWMSYAATDTDENFGIANLGSDEHVYSVEWTENEIVWYFDGQVTRRTLGDFCTQPMPAILSTLVVKWLHPTSALDGQSMTVNYVRVYTPLNQ